MSHDTDDTDDSDTHDRTTDAVTNGDTARYDWMQSGDPSVTIAEAVAAATGRSTTELPPLQRTIDSDALDALLTRAESPSVTVSFRYADTTVWVSGAGSISVQVDSKLVHGDD